MTIHRHRPKRVEVGGFTAPMSDPRVPDPRAHGCVTEYATCACGATRRKHINGPYVEWGYWVEPEHEPEDYY